MTVAEIHLGDEKTKSLSMTGKFNLFKTTLIEYSEYSQVIFFRGRECVYVVITD